MNSLGGYLVFLPLDSTATSALGVALAVMTRVRTRTLTRQVCTAETNLRPAPILLRHRRRTEEIGSTPLGAMRFQAIVAPLNLASPPGVLPKCHCFGLSVAT